MEKNKFEYLRKQGYYENRLPEKIETSILVSRNWGRWKESICIMTAEYAPGIVGFGFSIFLASGRSPFQPLSLDYGYFESDKHAKLWFLGYCLSKASIFLPETIALIHKTIAMLQQGNIDF